MWLSTRFNDFFRCFDRHLMAEVHPRRSERPLHAKRARELALDFSKLNLQPFHRATVNQVLFNDFVDVFAVDVAVPGAFRIDDDDRPLGAAVEATGRIDTHLPGAGQTEFLAALFGIVAHRLGIETLAAGTAVLAKIRTKEHVMFVVTHRTPPQPSNEDC